MDYKKQIGKSISALLLLVALMLPTSIQFIHMLEDHEEVVCTDQTPHIHKTIIKCEVCSFYLASFNYENAEHPDLLLPIILQKTEVNFTSLLPHSFTITNTQLRGPPIFS
jgi:hypothetical protein